jgi:hypothetical protein
MSAGGRVESNIVFGKADPPWRLTRCRPLSYRQNFPTCEFCRKSTRLLATIPLVKAIYLIPAAISLMLPALARAELKWEQTTLDLKPTLTDKQAVGHFKYQNSGDKPIKFKSVKASCGCTAAQSQKDQVAPGEKGEITATFTIGDRTGEQVKTVTVETDDAAHPVTVLTLKTNIPQILEVQPNFVFWQSGEEPKAKTIMARIGKDAPVKNLDVTSVNPQFDVKVNKEKNSEYRIDIQPKETKTPSYTTVTVKTDYPKESHKIYYVTARVMAPVPSPAPPTAVTAPAVPAPSAPGGSGH